MNTFMNELTEMSNAVETENGAAASKTTGSDLYDLFALGGAYRYRTSEDCILLFKNAFEKSPTLALKCLFYLRDCRGGQGERRFFRVCFNWLANNHPDVARHNLLNVSEFGRWDDLLYSTLNTIVQDDALEIIKHQLALDTKCQTPSLLAKWLPSENASSQSTKRAAGIVRNYLGMSHKEYRKVLSELRKRINIVEKLMSENRWDEIEFDKIPSKAGFIYKNAFARRDIIAKKYETFAKDTNTKVHAGVLYPYEVVSQATQITRGGWGYNLSDLSQTDRAMINKYWENLPDYLNGNPCSMMCVVDTSGSMTGSEASAPINVAISLGLYCAERIGGPFKNHYVSFSSRPQLIKTEGVDFVDKVRRIYKTNLCSNTNIKATFDLFKKAALSGRVNLDDLPKTLVIISDMQIDYMSTDRWSESSAAVEMQKIRREWEKEGLGFHFPRLVYWNVNARGSANIIDAGPDVSFVSGFSPVLFKSILTGKNGYDLMIETITADRYKNVW